MLLSIFFPPKAATLSSTKAPSHFVGPTSQLHRKMRLQFPSSVFLLGFSTLTFNTPVASFSGPKALIQRFRNKNNSKSPSMPPLTTPSSEESAVVSVSASVSSPALTKTRHHYADNHMDIENILEQNAEWVSSKLDENPNFFHNLGKGHSPKYLWIGCSDARVPSNEIMGEDAGTVFVVRNIANLVVGTDFNLMSALQYAVGVLDVPHIIVCGHYDCGGVRASIENRDHVPPLENWLRNIRDVYRMHRNELDAIKDPEQRHRRLVELNVVEQCINLFKTGAVQRHRVETYLKRGKTWSSPRIHACVFDPKDGILRQLKVDFRKYIEEFQHIYDLYTVEETEKMKVDSQPHTPEIN